MKEARPADLELGQLPTPGNEGHRDSSGSVWRADGVGPSMHLVLKRQERAGCPACSSEQAVCSVWVIVCTQAQGLMGLCEGLGAIYSDASPRELLIVRRRVNGQCGLPAALVGWGLGKRHPGLVPAPTQAVRQGPLLSGQQLSRGSRLTWGSS